MSKRADRKQARTEARLQYGPQEDALTSILKGLHADLGDSVKQARAGARMTEKAAKKALPVAKAIYAAGLSDSTPEQSFIRSELSKLDPSSSYGTAVKIGTGGATTRMKAGQTRTLTELVGRRVDAVTGGQQEVRALRQGYRSDAAKTREQLASVKKSKGLYESSRYGDLRGDAKKLGLDKSKAAETHRHNKVSEGNAAAKIKADAEKAAAKAAEDAKPKDLTPAQKNARRKDVNKTVSEVNKAIAQAKQLAKARPRHEAAQTLLIGRPMQTIKQDKKDANGKTVTDANGKTVTNTIKVPAIDSFDQVIASVGLDIAYDGHISAKNQAILRKRYPGVLKALGLPLKGSKKPINTVAGITVPRA